MYCKFYRLKERPFNATPDPGFFFLSKRHREAFSHLAYGVNERKGIIVITGEIGTGKTTLCRFFLNRLDKNINTAVILNPYLSEAELLEAVLNDFGLRCKGSSRIKLIWELNRFLLKQSEAGNNAVLIVDESQCLKPETLEQIRLLSNLETEKDKLLQIVLVGQPELSQKLNLYELRQLKQRVMVNYHISPLDETEIRDYVNHRLSIAGAGMTAVFTDEAIKLVSEFSAGTPRLINMICDRALLCGFSALSNIINREITARALEELNLHFAHSQT